MLEIQSNLCRDILHRHRFVFQLEYQGYKASNVAVELNTGLLAARTRRYMALLVVLLTFSCQCFLQTWVVSIPVSYLKNYWHPLEGKLYCRLFISPIIQAGYSHRSRRMGHRGPECAILEDILKKSKKVYVCPLCFTSYSEASPFFKHCRIMGKGKKGQQADPTHET